jgi:hypothetical protein
LAVVVAVVMIQVQLMLNLEDLVDLVVGHLFKTVLELLVLERLGRVIMVAHLMVRAVTVTEVAVAVEQVQQVQAVVALVMAVQVVHG